MTLKYYLFLSCKDMEVENYDIGEIFDTIIKSNSQACDNDGRAIECLWGNNYDIKELKKKFDTLKPSSIYIVNMHEKLDEITYWEIGYAMGKEIEIIGYYDGKSKKTVHEKIESLLIIPKNNANFIDHIGNIINTLEPTNDIIIPNWRKQFKFAEKEKVAEL